MDIAVLQGDIGVVGFRVGQLTIAGDQSDLASYSVGQNGFSTGTVCHQRPLIMTTTFRRRSSASRNGSRA